METLPIELLHRIFDDVDTETILFSVRSVSRLFRAVVNTYNRYCLSMKSIPKSNFYLLCRFIKPCNVISLTLSNDEKSSDQIDLFVSLVRLRQFTCLRSITLLNIDQFQLNFILKRINLQSLTSLSFTIRKYDDRRTKTTNNLLLSLTSHSKLRKLEYDITAKRMAKVTWPINSTIQYLTINNSITMDCLLTILQSSPYLHTITMKKKFDELYNHSLIPKYSSSTSFQQLRSLTIEELNLTIDQLESYLSLTPSLVYLKLIGRIHTLDGKRWEQFIELNLPHLNKFEFFFTHQDPVNRTHEDLQLMLASFQTLFWTEHKKWLINCEYYFDYSTYIRIYTKPICKSSLEYEPKFKKLSLSTSDEVIEDNPSVMTNVESMVFTWDRFLSGDVDEKKAITNRPLFAKVIEIDINLCWSWMLFSFHSFSILIDVQQIHRMKLQIYCRRSHMKSTWTQISILLEQACNLSSLMVDGNLHKKAICSAVENMYSLLPRQLKHLKIPINNLDKIERILGRCENLSTIRFNKKSKLSKEIIQWFRDNTTNSSYWKDKCTTIIWLGKKMIPSSDDTIPNKRIKLTDDRSNSESI
ncbi:unnamed protein product [Adineta steineri]|uniref:F-box domain-containing protein n=1 Tax=Adineta steineri TaxID=433720 RepID=A0A813TTI4_9BILA|nr:unnamed protein product [Adineta steineri]CAF3844161.1 unnamed protein product [Adineta steineri]